MIFILWKGNYYILVSVNKGIANFYIKTSGKDKGISISTVELVETLMDTEGVPMIVYRNKKYLGYYLAASTAYPGEFEFEPKSVGGLLIEGLATLKEHAWLGRKYSEIRGVITEIARYAQIYDKLKKSEDGEIKIANYFDDYIFKRKLHLAFPSSMSGDIYYILKACDFKIYKLSETIIHIITLAKSSQGVANNTIRLLLLIAFKKKVLNIYFSSSSATPYPMKQGVIETDGSGIAGYAKPMLKARNAVIKNLEAIDNVINSETSKLESKIKNVLNPFACTCIIGENNWYGNQFKVKTSLFGLLIRSSITESIWKEKKEAFLSKMGFIGTTSSITHYVFVFYRYADYHPVDNTTTDMINYVKVCYDDQQKNDDQQNTKLILYGNTNNMPSIKKFTKIDPYDFFQCEGETNKFLFWLMVKEVLNGKIVKIIGPRSGSVDVAAMFGFNVYTWHQFRLDKGDICGGLRLLLSAPAFMNVFLWTGKVCKKKGDESDMNDFDANKLVRGNALQIRLRYRDPVKANTFDQVLPRKTYTIGAVKKSSTNIFSDGVSDTTWGVNGDLGNVSNITKDTDVEPVTDNTVLVKRIELRIWTKNIGGAEVELDAFLELVLVAAGGRLSDLHCQIEKKRDDITTKVNNVFIYKFYS